MTIVLAALLGCSQSDSSKQTESEDSVWHEATEKQNAPATESASEEAPKGDGFSGRHRQDPDNMWVPAEFKKGASRFKDPGVYVDGVPVGMVRFGELPVPLEPYWHEERASVPYKQGDAHKPYKIVKQRRYRWLDYFNALGIDTERIDQVHIYGGAKRRAAVVVTGKELREHGGFMFRFGSDVYGKTIPACPNGVGDGKCPDVVGAVAVYIDKKAPIREGAHFYLNGERLKDIPYFGEPLRGGVRIYKDGSLATTIKRRKLTQDELKVTTPEGDTRWKFFAFLEMQGVDTKDITEAWVIRQNKRVQKLTREQIENATFEATGQKRGEILFGDMSIPTNALALHTKPVSDSDLPVFLPHELEDA
jgi:hypothetical protein